MRALRPDQLLAVPDNVIANVSQFAPSIQVLSSAEPPPTAVPTQFTCGPVGLSVPDAGCAECKRAVESPNTLRKIPVRKKSAPIVARAVIEVEATIFIGRSGLILPYDSGNFVGVVALLGQIFSRSLLQPCDGRHSDPAIAGEESRINPDRTRSEMFRFAQHDNAFHERVLQALKRFLRERLRLLEFRFL